MANCPNCGLVVPEIFPIDLDLRDRLKKADPSYPVNVEICKSCIVDLRKKAYGSGGLMLMQEKAKDDRKKKLWSSRVALVK